MDSVNVYLLNENGEVTSSKNIGEEQNHTFVTSVTKGGTYYVVFESADNSTGSYELDTTKAVFGDYNSDGKTDVNDVTILQMFIAGGYKFSDLKTLSADIDGDGLVMVTDVTYLQIHIANGEDSTLIDITNKAWFDAADMDGDGNLDVIDATALQIYIA